MYGIYRQVFGFRPQLQAANLQPIQITELEAEFAKIEGQKAIPQRYVRSQQAKQAVAVADVQDGNGMCDFNYHIHSFLRLPILTFLTIFKLHFSHQKYFIKVLILLSVIQNHDLKFIMIFPI